MSKETDRAVAVKCNHCEYMTADGDLETCPECGLADALMDMDAETVALQWNARRAAANAHDALSRRARRSWPQCRAGAVLRCGRSITLAIVFGCCGNWSAPPWTWPVG